MLSFAFRRQLVVEPGHCDPAGLVTDRRLFEYFDASTWMLFEAALGVERQNIASKFRIVGFPVVDTRANFLKPIRLGNLIEITSRVAEFRRSSFDVKHQITVDGELAVDGSESRVWAERDKSDENRLTSSPLPSDVISRFQ